MRFLQRLIQKARNYIPSQSERLAMAWITPLDDGSYEVSCRLDGVVGSAGRHLLTKHDTMQEADEYVDKIAAQYPNQFEEVNVFIDDVEE